MPGVTRATEHHDRIHLIENQPQIHKTRPRPKNSIPKKTSRENENSSSVPLPSEPPTSPPAASPVTTVVISSSNSVHVAQNRNRTVDKRTGRYLALGVTLTMILITLYHTFLRSVPLLAGLVPPAIIMALYLLWIVYFAKKRKRQDVEIELA